MSVEVRGGVPRTIRLTAANSRAVATLATAEPIALPFQTKHLRLANIGANVVRVYWTKADFDADVGGAATNGFLELAATTGTFDGPVEARDEGTDLLFLRAVTGASDVVATVFQKIA